MIGPFYTTAGTPGGSAFVMIDPFYTIAVIDSGRGSRPRPTGAGQLCHSQSFSSRIMPCRDSWVIGRIDKSMSYRVVYPAIIGHDPGVLNTGNAAMY
jgi:hypothetical protein